MLFFIIDKTETFCYYLYSILLILSRFDIISSGMYVTVILKGMSVFLFWDKGTRVSLQVHPNWKNKVRSVSTYFISGLKQLHSQVQTLSFYS